MTSVGTLATQLVQCRAVASGAAAAAAPSATFRRDIKRRQRDASAPILVSSDDGDVLYGEVAERLLDRLDDLKGYEFPLALELGSRGKYIREHLQNGRGGVKSLLQLELSMDTLQLDKKKRQEQG